MYIQTTINKNYRTKLRIAAASNETTMEDLFTKALELLFEEYEGILDGTQTKATISFLTSTERVQMNFNIDKEDNKKLNTLATKTGLDKSNFCNIAIQLLLQELGLLEDE